MDTRLKVSKYDLTEMLIPNSWTSSLSDGKNETRQIRNCAQIDPLDYRSRTGNFYNRKLSQKN